MPIEIRDIKADELVSVLSASMHGAWCGAYNDPIINMVDMDFLHFALKV